MQQKKPLNVEIGRRIQQSREKAGMTQEQLSEAIGRSTQFLSTVERGVAGPSLETVVQLCRVLNVTADWLILGKSAAPTSSTIAAKLSHLTGEQLIQVDAMTDRLLVLLEQKR
ncbi:MAG: helix-turn-helix transcriptional regulator [Oscillospiraceae bacterium]|nr:helix-turn-helix transcriptional regulator [Oscillospiraceae bacterium]